MCESVDCFACLFDLVQQDRTGPQCGTYQLPVLRKYYVPLQLLVQLVRERECWTFCGTSFSCWSVGKPVKVHLSTPDRKKSYDCLTANERMWPVRWADVRGEERVARLRTSAREANRHTARACFDWNVFGIHIIWRKWFPLFFIILTSYLPPL